MCPENFKKAYTMVMRRKEEEIVGVLEFEGKTSEDPEVMEMAGRAQGAEWGEDPGEPG